VAHVTQCPYTFRVHTSTAHRQGATAEEIIEAIWVAAEMRAGGTYAHLALALDTIARDMAEKSSDRETVAGVPRSELETKVMSWYDNEWGYANQLLRAAVSASRDVGR
jgi:AhpD family alkylhydroperoxidase